MYSMYNYFGFVSNLFSKCVVYLSETSHYFPHLKSIPSFRNSLFNNICSYLHEINPINDMSLTKKRKRDTGGCFVLKTILAVFFPKHFQRWRVKLCIQNSYLTQCGFY